MGLCASLSYFACSSLGHFPSALYATKAARKAIIISYNTERLPLLQVPSLQMELSVDNQTMAMAGVYCSKAAHVCTWIPTKHSAVGLCYILWLLATRHASQPCTSLLL